MSFGYIILGFGSSASHLTAPAASFNENSGGPVASGTTVTFTDTSSNSPTSWSWSVSIAVGSGSYSFAGGTNSSSQNPQVTLTNSDPHAPAIFRFVLTATNAAGSGASSPVDVIVNP